jgi:ABC-2 type transport system permease protein
MWTLLQIELFKIFRKPRTYIAFAAIAAIVGLIQLAFYVDGEAYIKFGMQALSESFNVEGKILNGYLVAYIILQTLLVNVPLLIALVAGDMISGEANMGTLRLLVSKPISRTKLILSKFLASAVYTIALLIWMAVWALFLSLLLFGSDDMIIMKRLHKFCNRIHFGVMWQLLDLLRWRW